MLKEKMLNWANRFSIFCFLDNHDFSITPSRHQCLLAAGAKRSITSGSLNDLQQFVSAHKGWYFGHLNYELGKLIHTRDRNREWGQGKGKTMEDPTGFPLLHFFEPEVLIELKDHTISITGSHPGTIYSQIMETQEVTQTWPAVSIQPGLNADEYMEKIKALREHIRRGDCYEINFCTEFFARGAAMDPVNVFLKLSDYSPGPFSCLYRCNNSYLVCTSPERFLLKQGNKLISQPMKGTIRRDRNNAEKDEALKRSLEQSAKDKAENVMVVDLVRNDLSIVCREGSVQVDELFGVYSYPHVHQMISTISGMLRANTGLAAILKATFPMGSMTGAPKIRVMELIESYEKGPRGIFSGTVGYIDPNGDFDLNVVIRSIMYNKAQQHISYKVGSGITFYSDPQLEWEECLLKGEALKRILEGKA